MPLKRTIERARKDKRAGKSPSTQAGEFVKEQIDKIRRGIHGARNTKQAIAIGLSEARTAGVEIPEKTSGRKKKKATKATRKASGRITKKKVSAKRSKAASQRLKKEPRSSVSKKALSAQAKRVAKKRGHASLSRSAKKAAATRRRNKS